MIVVCLRAQKSLWIVSDAEAGKWGGQRDSNPLTPHVRNVRWKSCFRGKNTSENSKMKVLESGIKRH
jgi:hypothetical protein